MTCAQIEGLLTRYMLGDLDPADLARVEEHLASCPKCRATVEELRPTVGLLRQALAAPSSEALKLDPARRARIFASYGQRKPQITILPMLLKAAAAVVILLVLAGLFLPALTKCKESARATAAIARERQLTVAVRGFESDRGRKPQSASDLSGYIEDNGLTDADVKRITEAPQSSSQAAAPAETTTDTEIGGAKAGAPQMNFLTIVSKSPSAHWGRLGKFVEGISGKSKLEPANQAPMQDLPFVAQNGEQREPAAPAPSAAPPPAPVSGAGGGGTGFGGGIGGREAAYRWNERALAVDNGATRASPEKAPTSFGQGLASAASHEWGLEDKKADRKQTDSSSALGIEEVHGLAMIPPAAAPAPATPAPVSRSRTVGGRVAAEGPVSAAPGSAGDQVQTLNYFAVSGETGLKTTDGRVSGGKDQVAELEGRQLGLSATTPASVTAPVVEPPVALKGLAADRTYNYRAPAKAEPQERTALRSDLRDADGDGMADHWEKTGGAHDVDGRRADPMAQTIAAVGGTIVNCNPDGTLVANAAPAPVAMDRLEKSIEPLQKAAQGMATAIPAAKPDETRAKRALGELRPITDSNKQLQELLPPIAMDGQQAASDLPAAATQLAQADGQLENKLAEKAERLADKAGQQQAGQAEEAKPMAQAQVASSIGGSKSTLIKLERTVIPEIEFRQANIHDIVDFLSKASVEGDRLEIDPQKKGVNFVLNLDDAANKQIGQRDGSTGTSEKIEPASPEVTFTARYISMLSALKIITQVSGLKYRIDDGIVFIEPANANPAQTVESVAPPPEITESTEPTVEPVYPPQVFNPIVESKQNAFSTFGLDVDTASFTLARRYLLQGKRPPEGAIRVEEFVNAFEYAYRAPERDTFTVYADRARSPFRPSLDVLRIAVRGKVIGRDRMKPSVLTFVIDTSGSMNTPDRLDLIRKSLVMLVDHLAPQDTVTVVAFGSEARLVLDQTKASHKDQIRAAINSLQTAGSTHLEAGLKLGYQMAARNFASGSINRVLLLSDGVANLGAATAEEILAQVERYRKQGIYCSVFGVGQGTYNDTMLGTLADKGDGVYRFVDSPAEAKRVFVDELAATLCTIAKDVKIQVQFDPDRVTRYRQLGYEKRHLEQEQFRDDTVDAGEVGAGQSATALYEVAVAGNAAEPLGTVRLRWKDADTGQVEERAIPIKADDRYESFEAAPVRFRLAAGVAEFADLLRRNPNTAGTTIRDVAAVIRPVGLELNLDQQVQALVRMVNAVRE